MHIARRKGCFMLRGAEQEIPITKTRKDENTKKTITIEINEIWCWSWGSLFKPVTIILELLGRHLNPANHFGIPPGRGNSFLRGPLCLPAVILAGLSWGVLNDAMGR